LEESLPSTPSSKANAKKTNTVKRLKKSNQENPNNRNKSSNSSNEMIVISNAVKYEPKKLTQLNAAQNTNFKVSSESLSSNSSSLFLSNNAPKSNKLKAMTDVLKAVDGDIIFGCNYSNQEMSNKSPFRKYDLERDLSESTHKNTSDSFKSNKKISLSIDSLLNRKNEVKPISPLRHSREIEPERQKKSNCHIQSPNFMGNTLSHGSVMVDGLKRNLNCNLEEDVAKKGHKAKSINPCFDQKNNKTFENEDLKGIRSLFYFI
jgi:hypothetical protein